MMRETVIWSYTVIAGILLVWVAWQCYANFTEMDSIRKETENLENHYYNLEKTLENLTVKRDILLTELSDVESKVNNTKEKLQHLQDKINKLRSRDKYMLHDPSYAEAVEFIGRDKTDGNEYVENEYVCTHFARDVNNHAESEGIRCGFVIINLTGNANHAIIAFNTTDRGLVFFEPQTDERVRYLETGKDYWADCVIPAGNYYYERDPNNIIEGFIIIW